MKKLLFVVHRIPYPPNKGDKIRSFNELKYLSSHCSVDLLCLADKPDDLKYAIDLQRYCDQIKVLPLNSQSAKIRGGLALLEGKPLSSRYFYLREMQTLLDHWLQEREYDAILCFSSSMAEYIFHSQVISDLPSEKWPRLVMDICDVDSDKWRQYASDSFFPLRQLYEMESKRLQAYEQKIQSFFHHAVLVSNGEADLFRVHCPDCENLSVIANGVDHTFFSPSPMTSSADNRNKPMAIVFTGAMDYPVNISGVLWFVQEVWPKIRHEYPFLKFYVVGSNPVPEIRRLDDEENITVTGFVDDIRDYYNLADICVAPLHLGRGVQNKVLEAMAMGKPLVTTSKANAGVQGEGGRHLLIADTAEAFIEAISCLIINPDIAAQLGRSAREFVVNNFDWDVNMMQLQKLLLCENIEHHTCQLNL
jgi:sugar transferase (PEP-CTERM/EpsH1 system associated)